MCSDQKKDEYSHTHTHSREKEKYKIEGSVPKKREDREKIGEKVVEKRSSFHDEHEDGEELSRAIMIPIVRFPLMARHGRRFLSFRLISSPRARMEKARGP